MVYPVITVTLSTLSPGIVANRRGGGFLALGTEVQKVYCRVMIKNCNDMDIRVGLITKWGIRAVSEDSGG